MNALQSLTLNALVVFATVLIGWSTEVRRIITTRAHLVSACGAEGLDERLAFEVADVDRNGVERRLLRAALGAAITLIIAFFPERLVALHLSREFGWSLDTRLATGTILSLVGPVIWSGLRVRRHAIASGTI